MQEFEKLIKIRKRINRIDDKIEKLKNAIESPKGQIVSDMPKAHGAQQNSMDDFLIKLEREEEKRLHQEINLLDEWGNIFKILYQSGIPLQHIHLLKYRYFYFLPWKSCLKRMQKDFPHEKWNENKCFRVFRKDMAKLTREREKNCAFCGLKKS